MRSEAKFVLFHCLFSLHLCVSHSAVMSIDLGSEWLKVAVVNLKPGQSPITIAINEMSKRKSPALVGFQSGTRLLGEEAAGIVARHPDKVFSQLRDMVGKPYDQVKSIMESAYLPFDIQVDSGGAVNLGVNASGVVYSVQELLAMVFVHAVNLAEGHAKAMVKDAVITVPPYFGQAERKSLLHAAQLAGINVLSLINEHSGAALQYGIDKEFSNESRHVVFFDMGSKSTYAALVCYSAYNVKEFGKMVSINQFQVKDVKWDAELGGQTMESRLVEFFADEFNKQIGNGVDVRRSPKAMAKLKKQVKRTKEILSANTMAPLSVESLYDDVDFRSTISREKFEELCSDLWERCVTPIDDVIRQSGLKMNDIYAVELIGGATRVPKLQGKIQEFLGRNDLDKHLDADEAIVLGAALHAANLSDGIKLNRKLGMIDGSSYGFMIELNGPDILNADRKKQLLVPRLKKLPTKMFRSIVHDKDFEVSLFYNTEDPLPPGINSHVLAEYAVSGLAEANEKFSSRNMSSPIKANMHYSLSRSGVISFDRAEAVIEISEWVDVVKKNLSLENATAPNLVVETIGKNVSEAAHGNLDSNEGTENNSNITPAVELVTEKKLKKRTFRVPLKVVEKTVGIGMSRSSESQADSRRKLDELDRKDKERRLTAELKNNLEGYIYSTKEKIESSMEFEKISTIDERRSFFEKLDEAQEWLYTDGEDASAITFQKHLDSLKSMGDPIFLRHTELSERPAATKLARDYLGNLQQIIVPDWKTKKQWLPSDKLQEIIDDAHNLKAWLDEKEAEQSRMSGFNMPIFTSDEVYTRLLNLQDKVASVNKIPKPKAKVEKPKRDDTKNESLDASADREGGEAKDESGGHDEL